MTLAERLAQAQAQERQIQQQITAYEQEIQRLAPQLWAVRGRVSLLIEMTEEEERTTREATHHTAAADPAAGTGQPE